MVLNIILLIAAAIVGMVIGFEINYKELKNYIKTNNELADELMKTSFDRDANKRFMEIYLRAYEDQLRFNHIYEVENAKQKRTIKELKKRLKEKKENKL